MTQEEFAITTKTMEDYFGKDLNYSQRDMWFNELKGYDVKKYEKAIKFLCGSSRYRPLLNEVIETMRTIRIEEQPKEKVPCKACHGTGYVIYHKVINGMTYDYACQCNCPNAIGKDYDGTKIADKDHRSQYYLEKGEKIFCGRSLENEQKATKPIEKDINKVVNTLAEQMTI